MTVPFVLYRIPEGEMLDLSVLRRAMRWFLPHLMRVLVCNLIAVALILSGCTFQGFLVKAEQDLPIVLQIITNITGIVAPGVSVGVAVAGKLAQAGLQVVCGNPAPGATTCDPTSLIGQYSASKSTSVLGKIEAGFADVQAHLQDMLTAARVLDQAHRDTITGAVTLAETTLLALESLIPTSTPATTPTVAARRTARANIKLSVPNPADLRRNYNALVQAQYPSAVAR